MHKFYQWVATVALPLAASLSWAQEPAERMPLADHSLLIGLHALGDAYVSVGERGHVLISRDDGVSWQQLDGVPVRSLLTDVEVQGQNIWAVGHDTTVIHSPDGGASWALQFYDPDREVPLLAVLFLDTEVGFAIGAYGTLLTTDDGGQNWQDELISEEYDYHLNDIVLTDSGRLVVVAEAGFSFYSDDQGATWEAVELPYPGSMFGVLRLDSGLLAYGLRGNVQFSDDDGASWQELSSEFTNSLFGGVAVGPDSAVLVGANGTRLNYRAGEISDIDDQDSGHDIAAVVQSNGQLLMVGEEGPFKQPIR